LAGRGGLEGGSGSGYLAVLGCVLRATTKKSKSAFWGKKCTPRRKI